MKKFFNPTLAIAAIAILSFTTACKSKKKAIEPPKGEVEVVLPCSQFKSDGKYFRAYSFGRL